MSVTPLGLAFVVEGLPLLNAPIPRTSILVDCTALQLSKRLRLDDLVSGYAQLSIDQDSTTLRLKCKPSSPGTGSTPGELACCTSSGFSVERARPR